jgi:hypothetical protein
LQYGRLICSNELLVVQIPCGKTCHIYLAGNSECDEEGKIARP